MRRLLCCLFCAVTVSVCACGGGENSSSGGAGSYLGSYLTPNPAGGTAECSNFYGPASLKSALSSTFNRATPCPTELALGACEVPTGSGATAMQVEMVYYEQIDSQGKKVGTSSFEGMKDGDPCNTNGVWRKPYAATPPASVSPTGATGGAIGIPDGGTAEAGGAPGTGAPQTGVKHIWGGLAAMCALLADDSVKCWGNSVYGFPSRIAGIEGAVQVAIGESHFCGLTRDGQVKCWGSNDNGQLGTGGRSSSRLPPATLVPTPVPGISNVIGITGGWKHTSALLADGTVMCWGLRAECGLPPSPTAGDIFALTPQAVPGLQQVTVIQAGSYEANYAVLSTGGLMRFKDAAPAAVDGVTNVANIAVGFGVFAQTTDGSVYGWGDNLPLDYPRSSATPKLLAALASAKSIASTDAHACALLADATVACWGNNSEGAVDGGKTFSGTTIIANTPVVVPGVLGAVEIATTRSAAYALLSNGTIMYWGGGGGTGSARKPVLPSLLPE